MTRTWYDPKPGTTGDIRDRKSWEIRLLNGKAHGEAERNDRIDAAHAASHLVAKGLDWLIPVRYRVWTDAISGLEAEPDTDLGARLAAANVQRAATSTQMAALTSTERVRREVLRFATMWMPDAHYEDLGFKAVRPTLFYAGEIATHLRDRGFGAAAMGTVHKRRFLERAHTFGAPVPEIASALLRTAL